MDKNTIFHNIYGIDTLSIFMLLIASILDAIAWFNQGSSLEFLGLAGLVLIGIVLFRFFSKNRAKRWGENLAFLEMTGALSAENKEKTRMKEQMKEQKKDFKFFDCPRCKLRIRVPKGKGRIEITCPKCQTRFIKKT